MKSFVLTTTEDSLAAKALDRLSLVPANSVLVVVRSGILSRTFPVALNSMPVTVNQDMRAFLPDAGVDARFLAWQLVGREREVLESCSKDGTTVASIEGPALASFPLTVPPASEQTRIVEKLEELLSDLDAGVAELKAAQKKLAQYRQSLLKSAVDGSLTAQWRAAAKVSAGETANETGAQLLERILRERRARWEAKQLAKFKEQGKTAPKGWQDKYPEPVQPDTGDLPALPEGWVCATVDQLAELVSGNTPKDAEAHATATGNIAWFKVGDMNRDGNESWLTASGVHFDRDTALHLGMKLAPTGTIVFPKRGGAIATNKKRRLANEACFDLNTMGLVPAASTADWLWWWFQKIDLGRLCDGSNVPQINNPDIAPLAVPIPALAEQTRAIEILEAAFEGITTQSTSIEVALKQSAAQRKNILKAAFSGQLVPQDPGDEPASVLLERIRAGRAGRSGEAKRRGRKARKAT